jgi:hypothetical protein
LKSVKKTPSSSTVPVLLLTSARVKQVRVQIEEASSDYDREKLQERVAAGWRCCQITWRCHRSRNEREKPALKTHCTHPRSC